MARDLKQGDRVSWKAGSGRLRGEVSRVITTRTTVGGRTVAASASDPRYVVTDERTGKTTVRRGPALRNLAPAKAAPAAKPSAKAEPGRLRAHLPRLRWLAAAAVVALLGGLAAAYFTQAPTRLAGDYREQAKPAFESVDESMYAVFGRFRARFFRGLAIEDLAKKRTQQNLQRLRRAFKRQYRADRGAIAAANGAIADAEAAISEAEDDLVEVDSWPLLDGRGDLEDADEDAKLARAYLDRSRAFLAALGEVTAYSKRTLRVDEEITATVLAEAPDADAPIEVFRASIGNTVNNLEKAKRKLKRLPKPPADARAFEYATRAGLELGLDYYRTIQTAFENLDPGLFDTAGERLDDKLDLFGRQVLTRFFVLQSEGGLSDKLNEIEGDERELAERLDAHAGPRSRPPPLIPPDPDSENEKAA